MWCNKHSEGDTTGEHCHKSGGRSKSDVSIVYYLQKQKGAGNIEFKNPLEQIWRMLPLMKITISGQETYYHQEYNMIGRGRCRII